MTHPTSGSPVVTVMDDGPQKHRHALDAVNTVTLDGDGVL
jgi:hypothetical protein